MIEMDSGTLDRGKPVTYGNTALYRISGHERVDVLTPLITEAELERILWDMPVEERASLHVKGPIAKLARHFGLDVEDYFTDEEINLFIIEKGIRTSHYMMRGHNAVYRVAKSRGIRVGSVWKKARKEPDLAARVEAGYETAELNAHAEPISLKRLGGVGTTRKE